MRGSVGDLGGARRSPCVPRVLSVAPVVVKTVPVEAGSGGAHCLVGKKQRKDAIPYRRFDLDLNALDGLFSVALVFFSGFLDVRNDDVC